MNDNDTEAEILQRARMMDKVPADIAHIAWLRELTNELTRIRVAVEKLVKDKAD